MISRRVDKFIKIGKFLWVPVFADYLRTKLHSMEGPCCPKCRAKLTYVTSSNTFNEGRCPECGRVEKYEESILNMESNAKSRYQAEPTGK
jgi:hypothetical protein